MPRSAHPPEDETKRAPAIAVALEHRSGAPDAPRVTASGRGFTAEQILEIAFARGIKVREDSDLAEMLAAVGIGEEIPFAAFSAVAEILSYIYRANAAASGETEAG